MLASVCKLVPTIVAMAVSSKQVIFLATLCGARVVREAVSAVVVDSRAVSVGVWLVPPLPEMLV